MRSRFRIAPIVLGAAVLACTSGASGRDDTAATRNAAAPGDSTDARVVQADLARIAGDTAAAVWLVIVSDFQCPYCKLWHDSTAPHIKREYLETGKIRLAYLNYPLGQHPHAVPAAEAAMCAGAQGKFWAFHDSLFSTQREWAPLPDGAPVFRRIAGGTSVDTAAFAACLRDHVMRPMIAADRDRGEAQGVGGTPTFFIGSRRIDNAQPFAVFKPILDSAIAAARGGSGKDR
jgi:protein-disulfide isomerase